MPLAKLFGVAMLPLPFSGAGGPYRGALFSLQDHDVLT
jgi:hypothetical protein